MGHGTVADEIKGRAPYGGPAARRAGAILSIEEEGVTFRSYLDGATRFMGPETSMEVQAALGSDIALVFDECTPFHVERDYTARSTERTHRWLDRCLAWHAEHGPAGQLVYGIVQGGVDEDLRRRVGAGGRRPRRRRHRDRRLARRATSRRCTRSSTGRSTSSERTGRATCSASARSTTSCAASSSASTRSTARCRPASAVTAWRWSPTPRSAGASTSPKAPLDATADEPIWTAARARRARPATRAPTCTTCSARAS